jgi:hypothetical protein
MLQSDQCSLQNFYVSIDRHTANYTLITGQALHTTQRNYLDLTFY